MREAVCCMLQSEKTGLGKDGKNGREKKRIWRKCRPRLRHEIPRDVTATWCLSQVFPVSPRAQTHTHTHPILAAAAAAAADHAPKHLNQSSGLQPHCTHYAARCDKGRQARTQDVSGGRGSDVFWRMEGSWLNWIPGRYWRSSTPGPCPACIRLKARLAKTGGDLGLASTRSTVRESCSSSA